MILLQHLDQFLSLPPFFEHVSARHICFLLWFYFKVVYTLVAQCLRYKGLLLSLPDSTFLCFYLHYCTIIAMIAIVVVLPLLVILIFLSIVKVIKKKNHKVKKSSKYIRVGWSFDWLLGNQALLKPSVFQLN